MGHDNGQPDDSTDDSHIDQALRVVHHKVPVTGSGGVTATVIVTVRRGQVWLSIQPPFTWEAIMAPDKADEVMRTLGRAGEEARRMVSASSAAGNGRQPVGNGTVAPGNTAVGTTKEEQ